jgi:hypothetical protein
LLIYATLFAAGMSYLMLVVSDLHWPKELIFPGIGVWAITLGLVWWFRYRRDRESSISGDRTSSTQRQGRTKWATRDCLPRHKGDSLRACRSENFVPGTDWQLLEGGESISAQFSVDDLRRLLGWVDSGIV